jgi:K+-transporting ATPase KdpF subunit
MFRQDGTRSAWGGFTVLEVLAFQGLSPAAKSPGAIDHVERVHGGPMTVVAGIVALLLLGYLVVALLKPERF